MEKIKKLIEALFKDVSSDPTKLAARLTREEKQVIVIDFEPKRSLLLVVKDSDPTAQSTIEGLPDVSSFDQSDVDALHRAGKVLLGLLEVKRPDGSPGGVVYPMTVWSQSSSITVLIFSVAIRLWGSISPVGPVPSSVSSFLGKYERVKRSVNDFGVKTYVCDPLALEIDIETDVLRVSDLSDDNPYASLGKSAAGRLAAKLSAARAEMMPLLTLLSENDPNNTGGVMGPHSRAMLLRSKEDKDKQPIMTLSQSQKLFVKSL